MQIITPIAAHPAIINVPGDYPTIQAAINAASPGDTINVSSGTYYEHLSIGKSLTLQGEDRDTTIIDGNGTGTVVSVYANNVVISGFTIQNGGSFGSGIYLSSSNNTIIGNVFENSITSIRLIFSSDNTLSGNIIRSSYDNGIFLWNSPNNVISENNITDSGAIAFEIRDNSDSNVFERNILTNNTLWGIYVRSSSNNIFSENIINNGQGGVAILSSSSNNTFSGNSIKNNSEYGIQIGASSNNTFSGNSIKNNKLSIHLWSSQGNTFINNTISNNTFGIDLRSSDNNILYHNNFINNPSQVTLYDSLNTWDNGVEGNYWSDYAGQDLDGDGIGDTDLPHQGVDHFPLMNPWGTVPLFNIVVPSLTTIPNIDGLWSSGEWDDANEYTITGSGGTSYIRIKHNNTHLFIIIDSVWDPTLAPTWGSYEGTYIAFDTSHDGGTAPQPDDYLFFNAYSMWMNAWQGDGSAWSPIYGRGFMGAQALGTSPHSATPHRIDEIKVPIAYVGSLGAISGFYVIVRDDGSWNGVTYNYVEWPPGAGGNPGGWPMAPSYSDPCPAPVAWGHLKLTGLSHPVAVFSFSPFAPKAGDVVTFDASASYDPDGTIVGYTWDFGDGGVTTVAVPMITHVFSTDGSYAVNLTVTDNDGLTDCIIHTISVGAPVAAFSFSPSSPDPGDVVTFNASASYDPDGIIANYTWNFDDGTIVTVNVTVITHAFSANGSYNVNLTITDNDGLKDWIVHTVTVGVPPKIIAPFSTVTPFIDGAWSSWEWNDANEYTITGSGGTSFVRVKHDEDYLYIIIDSPWDTIHDPRYGDQWGMEGIYVAFDTTHNYGSASQADDYLFFSRYSVYMNSWRGNGTHWVTMATPADYNAYQDLGTSPHSATVHRIDEYKVPLTYVGPGGFYIIVRDDGSWNGTTYTDYVEWPPAAGGNPDGWPMAPSYSDPCPAPSAWGHLKLTRANLPPVAAFTYSPVAPNAGDVVTFNASTSYDPDGTIANYAWDFGDGTVITVLTPVINHTFSAVGVYAVNLTVTDNDGLTDWVIHKVTVEAPVFTHDLLVYDLEVSDYLVPGTSTEINATVYNGGSSNETNIEFQLLINGSVVKSTIISFLQSGSSYTLSYLWSPVLGTYNITAYAVPVLGENYTDNNRATKIVEVVYPLINPVEGQWANYTLYYFNGTMIGEGEMRIVYGQYVSPYLINVTIWQKYPDDRNYTTWMLVNIMNRQILEQLWVTSEISATAPLQRKPSPPPPRSTMYYFGWIETNITLGSTINLLGGTATVVGSRIIEVEGYPVDCWELTQEESGVEYTFWYDKASGLLVGLETGGYPYQYQMNITLVATNIPIGVRAPVVTATVDVNPETLNLRSKGKWITCHIELPEGYDVGDIEVFTIRLNDVVPAESSREEGKKLMVKFDRSKVIALLPQAGEAKLTITGTLFDGTIFEGSDIIRVNAHPPKSGADGEEWGLGNPEGWLLYPDKEGVVLSGTVTIRWDPDKVETDTVIIEWQNRHKCSEDMVSEVCWQLWFNPEYPPVEIAEVDNTGEYEWDTTQYLTGDYNHIRIRDPSGSHWDASDYPFAIQN